MEEDTTVVKRLIDAPEQPFLAIRQEYVAICDGDACAAALLGYFENMTLFRKSRKYEHWEWVYVAQEALPALLLHVWGKSIIKRGLMRLRTCGYLQTKKRISANQPLEYRFEVEVVQAAVCRWLEATRAQASSNQPVSQIQPTRELDVTDALVISDQRVSQIQPTGALEMTSASVENDHPSLYIESILDQTLRTPDEESNRAAVAAVRAVIDGDAPQTAAAAALFEVKPPELVLISKETAAPSPRSGDPLPQLRPQESATIEIGRLATLWMREIGKLTALSRDDLVDLVKECGAEAVEYAIKEAVSANVRTPRYVRKVAERKAGIVSAAPARGSSPVNERYANLFDH